MLRRASVLALVFALHACNSDDTEQWPPDTTGTTGATTTTTGPPTTGELTSTTTTTTSTTTTTTTTDALTTGEPPPPPPTCKDVLDCVLPCLLGLDFECAQACAEGLPPGEGAEVLELGLCVGMACFESGACSADSLMDPACLACIGFLLMDPDPKGCEAEAEACAA